MKRSIRLIALSRQCYYAFAVFHEEVNKVHCFVKAVLLHIWSIKVHCFVKAVLLHICCLS